MPDMSETDKDKEDMEKETQGPDDQPEEREEGHDLTPGDIPIDAGSGESETRAEAEPTVSVKGAEAETEAEAKDGSKDREKEGKGEKGEEKTPADAAYSGLAGRILNFSRAVWGRGKSFPARIVPRFIWAFVGQNKKVVFITLACFLILGTVVFSFLLGRRHYGHSSPSGEERAGTVIKGEKYSFKPFLIPFNEGGTDVFLRVRVDLVTEEGVVPEIRRKELMLREAIYAFFLSKKLAAVQQGQDDKALADELSRVLNNYLRPKRIQRILFVDYVFT